MMSSHRVTGLHAVFSLPAVYDGFQKLIGAHHVHQEFVRQLDVRPGQRVLDLGCGTGFILDLLPSVDYTGVDLSAEYIAQAQAQYGNRGRFLCQRFDDQFAMQESGFDRIIALGLLHHLDDAAAAHVFKLAHAVLKPDGLLCTIDPCFTEPQSPLATWLIKQDRGQAVRRQEIYLSLAGQHFEHVQPILRHDLLRIPYTHLIMACRPS